MNKWTPRSSENSLTMWMGLRGFGAPERLLVMIRRCSAVGRIWRRGRVCACAHTGPPSRYRTGGGSLNRHAGELEDKIHILTGTAVTQILTASDESRRKQEGRLLQPRVRESGRLLGRPLGSLGS
jgi:hypothetical protein